MQSEDKNIKARVPASRNLRSDFTAFDPLSAHFKINLIRYFTELLCWKQLQRKNFDDAGSLLKYLTKTKTLVLYAKMIKDYSKRFRSTGAFYNCSAIILKKWQVRKKHTHIAGKSKNSAISLFWSEKFRH